MRLLLLIFILMPIIEIGVFIQVSQFIDLIPTLLLVLATAIIGVKLLKSQGMNTWQQIQIQLSRGEVPALALASAAQLLFAGGLLLTPGFVTDTIGFLLLIPAVRNAISLKLTQHWTLKTTGFQSTNQFHTENSAHSQGYYSSTSTEDGRTIEGEFEDKS